MEIVKNYLEYRKFKPEYKEWKQKRNEEASKKEKYFKSNPLPEDEKQKQLEKMRVILNAVDTMDEFSQSKAENTEIATEAIKATVTQFAGTIGLGIGAALAFTKPGAAIKNKLVSKIPSLENTYEMFAMMGSALFAMFASIPLITWGTKNEIFASKIGRHEAVTTKLNSENQFAILDEKQKAEVLAKAENMTAKDDGILEKTSSSFKEAFATVGNLFSENEEVKDYLFEENKKFEAHKKNFDKPLSNKDIKTAKEEQEMITRIVEEIDTASQDYAEDVEFATGSLAVSATAIGAGLGFLVKKTVDILAKVMPEGAVNKVKEAVGKLGKNAVSKGGAAVKLLPVILGLTGMFAASIAATKLQKQASRVARFQTMKDLANNPEKLMYVDDEKLKDIEPEVKEKKENIFSFYKRLFKENSEYNKYLKANGKKDKNYRLALNEIKLTEKQKADAKQLQSNVFKAFNRIDDKSQTYSESTEAFGEMVKTYGTLFSMLAGVLGTAVMSMKLKSNSTKDIIKTLLPTYLGLIPAIALEFFVTKEQKGASRVAHMLAIKDLEDYKHFVDYNNLTPETPAAPASKENDNTKKPAPKSEADLNNKNDIFAKLGFKSKKA